VRIHPGVLFVAIAIATPHAAATQDARPSFADFLAGVRTEALARGIRPEITDAALANIEEPLPVVIERDRTQAETVLSLEKYLSRLVTPKLVTRGRAAEPGHALEEVGARYGVPPPILAAFGASSGLRRFQRRAADHAALATLRGRGAAPSSSGRGSRSSITATSRGDCEVRGRAPWVRSVHALDYRKLPRTSTVMDGGISGRRPVVVDRQLPGKWLEGRRAGRSSGVEGRRRQDATSAARRRHLEATRDMPSSCPRPNGGSSAFDFPAGGAPRRAGRLARLR
jgi:hypothetical protein